jgi:hypothetical protein
MFPGNANLPIGVLPRANQEIGVPRFTPMQFKPTVPCGWKVIPVGSPGREASAGSTTFELELRGGPSLRVCKGGSEGFYAPTEILT